MSGDYREPYYDTGQTAVYLGDVRDVLRALPAESVNCVVTSPPYWSLRDYGIDPSIWGGDAECAHEWGAGQVVTVGNAPSATKSTLTTNNGRGPLPGNKYSSDNTSEVSTGQFCGRCNAWRGALGLEPTPALFVAHMVEVFRDVRRVLRKDGTAFVNLGDSYASGGQGLTKINQAADRTDNKPRQERYKQEGRSTGQHGGWEGRAAYGSNTAIDGLKPKDLVGIPWRVAFALREDGWWLRQDIIWAKPNPMPESVTDRCTKSHEYVFLLSKSATYYYDAEAIREEATWERWGDQTVVKPQPGTASWIGNRTTDDLRAGRDTRNKRSVWTIATAPFPEAHFATFPPDLVKPCILAGCPEGGTVLDPFFGSGTTGMVANSLGRKAIGIDLNPEYLEMARKRVSQLGMVLTTEGDEA